MTKRFIISTAVNNTPRHQGFVASMATYAEETGAERIVMAALYRNPTAKRGKAKRKVDQTYDPELVPFLTRKDIKLGRNLTLFGSVPVQPTANTALTGLEVYASGTSGIIGHVKRQLQVIPTDSRTPRVLWTTGACTIAKYSRSRAGARAAKHHVIGALIVEVEKNGDFFVRNVTANPGGSFTDLDRVYTPKGSKPAPRALSVVLGDIHVGQEDEEVLGASQDLVTLLKPKHLVLHDVYDGSSRSHHRTTTRDRFDARFDLVEKEVESVARFLHEAGYGCWGDHTMEVDVIRANHDEHLTRWLEEHDHKKDIVNDPYYCALKARCYAFRKEHGRWPNELELECRRLGVGARVKFIGREDSLKVGNVEHAFHGDKGVNGSRGSLRGYAKLGVKVTIGHSHTPGILDGAFQTGVTGTKLMGYNHRPSTWLHAHVVLGADGKRQMVIIVNGRFRAEPAQRRAA
jgi:hypothetical protein